MNGLAFERWYPLGGALVLLCAWASFEMGMPASDAMRDLFATTMSLAAITVGFLATAMSIVVAAPESQLIKQLSQSGYLKDLVRYLREPFVVGIVIAALCMAGFVLPDTVTHHGAFGSTWAFLGTWLLLGLLRVGGIFVKVIEHVGRLSLNQQKVAVVAQPEPVELPK